MLTMGIMHPEPRLAGSEHCIRFHLTPCWRRALGRHHLARHRRLWLTMDCNR